MVHLTQSHPVRPADLPPVQLRGETEWSSRCDLKTTIMGATFMDLESLAMDLGRLEMDRDSSDLVFVVGQDEAKVSGHAAIFSVRCTKFVDLVSNNNTNITTFRECSLSQLPGVRLEHVRTFFDSTQSQESKSEVCAQEFCAAMHIKTLLENALSLSSLWSDRSM